MRALPLLLLVASCQAPPAPPASRPQPSLERIAIAPDAHGFVTATARRTFHPWGMNYGNAGRLLEDFWDCEWPTLETDLRELQALGANVVRVHLQFGKFLRAPDQPDRAALAQLARLLHAAAATGIYLDITGLGCYRPGDVPSWYDAMQEPARWAAQACFWSAVAETCAGNPAVFCYDLANEPISPAVRREPGQWSSGSLFGGFDFLQYIALDPAGRKREDIAAAWIRRMTAAIRVHDRDTLITVGLLPWSRKWQHLSGFLPAAIAPELDFLSVHLYPDSKLPGEALEALQHFAVGKPVVIEETFPLYCSVEELETFLRASRESACGWLGHYDGAPPDELDALERAGRLTMAQAIHREWLRLFVRLGPEFAPAPGSAPRSETGIAWAYYNLQGELVEDAFVFAGDRIEVTQDKSLLVPGPPVGKGPYLGQGYDELVEVLGQPTNSTPTAMATQHVFGNGAVVEVSRGMVVAIRGG